MASTRAHAALGASSADRWMNCPASNRLSEGIPGTGDTDYSREGTSAHKVLEMALTRHLDAGTWLDATIEGVLVTENMTEAVQVCVDYVRDLIATHPGAVLHVEQPISLAALNPPADMFGTADIVIFAPVERTLFVVLVLLSGGRETMLARDGGAMLLMWIHVPGQRFGILDYMRGQGYAVKAVGNPQLRYYGLGSLIAIEKTVGTGRLDTIELTIVQPRAVHGDGIIRSEHLSYRDLANFADDILDAAHRTLDPKAQPKTGSHCRWCRAQAICPAQKSLAAATAQMDFSEETAPPDVETLTMDQLIGIYDKATIIKAWLKAVEDKLFGELNAGRPVAGYKLVEKRAMRKWVENETLVRARLEEEESLRLTIWRPP